MHAHSIKGLLDLSELCVRLWKTKELARIQEACQSQALMHTKRVLGIDDFAIRKGYTYNTGLHDLRNGTFLDINTDHLAIFQAA